MTPCRDGRRWKTPSEWEYFSLTLHSPSDFVRDHLHSPTSPPSSLPSSPTSAKERPTFPTILAYHPYLLPYLCAALCLWSGAYIDMLLTAAGDLRRDDSLRPSVFTPFIAHPQTALAIFFILHLRRFGAPRTLAVHYQVGSSEVDLSRHT